MTNEQLWQSVLGELEVSLSKANFTTWFKNTLIILQEDNKITVAVPNAFTKAWLENKYNKFIIDALKKITNNDLNEIYYKVTTNPQKEEKNNTANLKQAIKEADIEYSGENKIVDEHGLNPKYTFDNFIVGKSNELAYAASQAVVKNPGKSYNPLFIYSGVGLGKTHLLQAIGHAILKKNPTSKIEYLTSEHFTNQFIYSIRSGKIKDFQNKYRKVDVLIVDDIQFISGKEQTQEQMFHTFNDLHQTNKQIILSSDRTPKAIPDLESRLESRFEWGMIVDISEPDIETKIAIVQSKLSEKKFHLNSEIINYIADSVHNNIRELEGIVNRVVASCQLTNNKASLEEIKNIIKTVNLHTPRSSLTAKKLINTVANFFEINLDDLTGSSRKKELVVPRQIAMYLMREEINASFPNIGNELGGRDHTTAMHSYSKIKNELDKNSKIKNDLILIKQKMYNE
ncbi:chromosomal replication initiator protein DnaA [Patescibacteria group bacterium]|nr:chromosomal replication initiator protein DnaA [Patescibacteria group bacterium]MBU4482023.1 chromosomal replication initiator protein DnaA [Patescibacteria group bacterium]